MLQGPGRPISLMCIKAEFCIVLKREEKTAVKSWTPFTKAKVSCLCLLTSVNTTLGWSVGQAMNAICKISKVDLNQVHSKNQTQTSETVSFFDNCVCISAFTKFLANLGAYWPSSQLNQVNRLHVTYSQNDLHFHKTVLQKKKEKWIWKLQIFHDQNNL